MKKYRLIIYNLFLSVLLFFLILLQSGKGSGQAVTPAVASAALIFTIPAGALECWALVLPRYGRIPVADTFYYVVMALAGPLCAAGSAFLGSLIRIGVEIIRRKKVTSLLLFSLIQSPLVFILGGMIFRVGAPEGFGGDLRSSLSGTLSLMLASVFCIAARQFLEALYLVSSGRVNISYLKRQDPGRILICLATIVPISILIIIIYEISPAALALLAPPLILVYISIRRYADLLTEAKSTLEILAASIEARDPYMIDHSERVARYSREIGRRLKMPLEDLDHLESAARMHDLGKVSIADDILVKLEHLSEEEQTEIQKHASFGGDVTGKLSFCQEESLMIRHHHERFDGGGYPDGIQGEGIPLGARVIAVAEAFDALTTSCPYSQAVGFREAMEEIKKGAGAQFDPLVVDALEDSIKGRLDRFE